MAATPEGFNTITPYLNIPDAAQAIETYKKAFGAKELHKMLMPGTNKVMHACLEIGSSRIFISEALPEKGCAASSSSFYLYIDDIDQACRQAKQAGLNEVSAAQDQFWGDRTGTFKDRAGNSWTLATHVRDVSPDELQAAAKKMAEGKKAA